MKRKALLRLAATLLLLFPLMQVASAGGNEDTDTRFVDAKVLEVAEAHISVMARTGVEHVIAVNGTATKVLVDGKAVSLKDVREGDIVTVELDAKNPVKFAKNILMRSDEVARVRR